MIVVTGGAGFIGSCLVWKLNQIGVRDILIIDDVGSGDKWRNIAKRDFVDVVGIENSKDWQSKYGSSIKFVFHLGACSTTTETNADFLISRNTHSSMEWFAFCADRNIPFVYASSAATYGRGELGYDDDESKLPQLVPINKYAFSKQIFDQWILRQSHGPSFWAGLKFFNVYGPNEYHKGQQASVVYHAFPQVRDRGVLLLFKSYDEAFRDGEQLRDFVYVKDVVDVMEHFFNHPDSEKKGIYNVGSGQARTFLDLGRAVFTAMGQSQSKFDFIEMPESLRTQYQYKTEAKIDKLRQIGRYEKKLFSLEEGVNDYVHAYLLRTDPYL